MKNLTAPLLDGAAEYALGGSCIDSNASTIWDLAAAKFFSIRLEASEPTKSCTARSMAFTKRLSKHIGGFPENVLVGEDTLFDMEARRQTTPSFIHNAKAFYQPRYTFSSACYNMARYALSDGVNGVRWTRLLRNAVRCVAQIVALVTLLLFSLPWNVIPLIVVLAELSWFAFHGDWRYLKRFGARAVLARFAFSVAVPWVV